MSTLFDMTEPRKPRIVRMRVIGAGPEPYDRNVPGSHGVRYECRRCGEETDWVVVRNVTEAKRGMPCPACNARLDDMIDEQLYQHIMEMRRHLLMQGVHEADECDEERLVALLLPELCMAVAELATVTFQPGSWDKRFARDMRGRESFTTKQAVTILCLRHRYRRQIRPAADALTLVQPRPRKGG